MVIGLGPARAVDEIMSRFAKRRDGLMRRVELDANPPITPRTAPARSHASQLLDPVTIAAFRHHLGVPVRKLRQRREHSGLHAAGSAAGLLE